MTDNSSTIRRVYDLAYGRAGDKGNIANVSVIARSPPPMLNSKRS